MSKQCELTGVKISIGNNVSHAHNKTKRDFTPNLQKKNIYSDILNQMVRLKISTKALKSVYFDFLKQFGKKGSDVEFDSLNGPTIDEIVLILKKKIRSRG